MNTYGINKQHSINNIITINIKDIGTSLNLDLFRKPFIKIEFFQPSFKCCNTHTFYYFTQYSFQDNWGSISEASTSIPQLFHKRCSQTYSIVILPSFLFRLCILTEQHTFKIFRSLLMCAFIYHLVHFEINSISSQQKMQFL